jgi:hypothetical protein
LERKGKGMEEERTQWKGNHKSRKRKEYPEEQYRKSIYKNKETLDFTQFYCPVNM